MTGIYCLETHQWVWITTVFTYKCDVPMSPHLYDQLLAEYIHSHTFVFLDISPIKTTCLGSCSSELFSVGTW